MKSKTRYRLRFRVDYKRDFLLSHEAEKDVHIMLTFPRYITFSYEYSVPQEYSVQYKCTGVKWEKNSEEAESEKKYGINIGFTLLSTL